MKQYSRVRLLTDKYIKQGAKLNDIGNIIEVYDSGKYEVEFSDPKTGIDYAIVVVSEEDLEVLNF